MSELLAPDGRALPDVTAGFKLQGDRLVPAQVTKRIGIEPTRTHAQGDAGVFGRRWPSGRWMLFTERAQTLDVVSLMRPLLTRLNPCKEAIRQLMIDLDLEAELWWAITPRSTLTPVTNLPADIVAWAADIGATIDIDVMLWEEDDAPTE